MSLYPCTICGKRPCRSPDACAVLKPSYFTRREAARREALRLAEREACTIGIDRRGLDSDKLPPRKARRR